jgi:hypothetical protein
MLNNYTELNGMAHCKTALNWILGLERDLKLENKKDHFEHIIMKDGLFNPHYRNNLDDIWVKPKDVERFYFEMHLLNKGEEPIIKE